MFIFNKNTNKDLILVAEIGNNHEGDFAKAKDMIIINNLRIA